MHCPDYPTACTSSTSFQHLLTPSERSRLTAKALPFADNALRCSHCGLVYAGINPIIRLGYLDNALKGPGFQPEPHYE